MKMSEMLRAALCLLSTLIACGSVALSGAWAPMARSLHRWSNDVLLAFVVIFLVMMFLILKARVARSFWAIPLGGVLGYLAAVCAYVVYFAVFEPERFLNSLSYSQVTDFLLTLFLVVPVGSFAWLFGAVAAATNLFLMRTLQADT